MDKKIVDKLIQFGLITNICVDANKYTDVDDLIAKGIVTIPGAKDKIMELIGDIDITDDDDVNVNNATVVDDVVDNNIDDEPVTDDVVDDTIIVEDTDNVEDVVADNTPEPSAIEEVSETTEAEVTEVVKEEVKETLNKSKKSKKN